MAITITSANSVFLLGIDSVYPTPQQLQEFGVDDAFTTDIVDTAETQVGVDGYGVGGFVPSAPMMTIRFLASSQSITIFENWIGAQFTANEIFYANGLITQPSVKRSYTMYKGVLTRVNTLADARRVLQNREFHIQWLPNGPGVPAISFTPLL